MSAPDSSTKEDDILIDPKDFKSIELEFGILNNSTHTEVHGGKRVFGNQIQKSGPTKEEDLNIYLLEFMPTGLVLEVPDKTCAIGHNLTVGVRTHNAKNDIEFMPTGLVEALEVMENGKLKIWFEFKKYDETLWETFQAIFTSRQDEILAFFEAVKS